MTTYAYLFEAKSIQPYILDSGRLRDLVGASELVDTLTTDLLDKVLVQLGMHEGRDIHFSRRAGGAFYAFFDEAGKRDRFAGLWSVTVQQYAPAMAYDLGIGEGNDPLKAFDEAKAALRKDSSRMRPVLPVAAPLSWRSRRTGGVAVDVDRDGEPIDAATRRKQRMSGSGHAGLASRFSPDGTTLRANDWPLNLEPGEKNAFPFIGENRYIALIHADGNGLGQLLMNAKTAAAGQPRRFVDIFRKLSEGIATATRKAAQAATGEVLVGERNSRDGKPGKGDPLAARPVVLGGDDLTILVRADIALLFLRTFMRAFERESAAALRELEKEGISGLPERLTIGAGMVYLNANQPFYLAARLAESLTREAKHRAKAHDHQHPPSALAFHRVTTSVIDDYEVIVKREKTVRDGSDHYRQTLGAYTLERVDGLPCLCDLLDLQTLLQKKGMARGPTRQLMTLMGLAPAQARMHYRRWRQRMQRHKPGELKDFDRLLGALTPSFLPGDDLPYGRNGTLRESPIGDVTALMAAGNEV